jgi:hypothetical protein
MSIVAIIAIVLAALILVGVLAAIARRGKERREMGQTQVKAQHDDVRHHRDEAQERRREAALADERARRARAEAELNERRAGEREHELENRS